MPPRTRPLLLALAAVSLTLACTINPVTKKRELVLMDEARVGAQAARQVEAQLGLIRDPLVVSYVRSIGARLAGVSPRQDVEYRFFVVDQPEPNAFALPGGYIYVTRGLVALANSEPELANVMAHEVAHVAALHAAQREITAAGVAALTALAQIAALAAASGDAAVALGQLSRVAGAGVVAAYSRDQEREADEVGQELAARGGWDPAAMASFLRSLERETEIVHGERAPSFLDSHPATPDRVSAARGRARALPRVPGLQIAAGRRAFLSKIEGLTLGQDPAQGIFRDADFLHAELGFTLRFPLRWETRNTPAVVGAVKSDGSAMLTLELQGPGSDPREAALAWLASERAEVIRRGRRRVGELSAYRASVHAETGQTALVIDLTWIAYEERIYRIACAVRDRLYPAILPLCDRTAKSFRPLAPEARDSIERLALRVARGRDGESLEQLAERTRNSWSAAETAAMNGISELDPLRAGQLVKIAVTERYRSPTPDPDPERPKVYPRGTAPAPSEGATWTAPKPSAASRPSACCC